MAAGDTYFKHNQFLEDLAFGHHDLTNNTLSEVTAYLTNTLPTAANAVLADLTAPVSTNLSSRVFGAYTTSGQTAGQYVLKLPTLVLTATGTVNDFRYVGLYNDISTGATDALICWWDYEATVSMVVDDTFTISFAGNTFTIGA